MPLYPISGKISIATFYLPRKHETGIMEMEN
jgi:hypothetical protein